MLLTQKTMKWLKIILGFLSTVAFILLSCRNYRIAEYLTKSHAQQKETRGVDVVLVGQGRSGTTFLGELLNQHPLVFYIYEPLYSKLLENIFYAEESKNYREETTSIMEGFLSCNFTGKRKRHLKQFSQGSFKYRSRVLANYSYTPSGLVQNFKDICRTFQFRAIKVLSGRLPNVSLLSLEQLVYSRLASGRKVKIVHIVRDPRAVVNSWTRYRWIPDYPDSKFYRNAKRICEPLEKNLKLRRNLPKWLQNRYKFVRYEDMVLQPIKTVQDIYRFLGIDIVPEVMQWVESRNKIPSQHDLNYGFSTIRNATFTINKWKDNFSKGKRKAVEKACSEVLRHFNL